MTTEDSPTMHRPDNSWRRIVGLLSAALVVALSGPALAAPAPAATPAGNPAPAATPALSPRASADYQKARVLFKEGIKAFDDGYYNQAIVKFKAALKLFPSAKIHTRIALCYKWLGKNLKALEHYESFLKRFPKNPTKPLDIALRKRVAERMIPQLLAILGQLRISINKPVGTEVRINGKPVGQAPMNRLIRLNPGLVAVSASFKGYYGWKKDVTLKPKQTLALRITLIKIKPRVIRKIIKIRATPIYKRWWFWTAVGVLVAGGATALGVTLGIQDRPRELTGVPLRHDSLGLRW